MRIPNKRYNLFEVLYPNILNIKWYEKTYWGVVTKLNKYNNWRSVKYFTSSEVAELFSAICRFEQKIQHLVKPPYFSEIYNNRNIDLFPKNKVNTQN